MPQARGTHFVVTKTDGAIQSSADRISCSRSPSRFRNSNLIKVSKPENNIDTDIERLVNTENPKEASTSIALIIIDNHVRATVVFTGGSIGPSTHSTHTKATDTAHAEKMRVDNLPL